MCPTHKTRVLSDPQVYTHLALLPAIAIALCRTPPLLELVAWQGIVCVLSLICHHSHERECDLDKVEPFRACALRGRGAPHVTQTERRGPVRCGPGVSVCDDRRVRGAVGDLVPRRSARGSGNLGDGHRVVSRPLAVLVVNMSEFPLINTLAFEVMSPNFFLFSFFISSFFYSSLFF
jgi:hypothetical protein